MSAKAKARPSAEPWEELLPPAGDPVLYARLARAFGAVTDEDHESALGLIEQAHASLLGDGASLFYPGRVVLGHAYKILRVRQRRARRARRREERAARRELRRARKKRRKK